jgi:CBS domain containing-hemolysin-like protein
MSRLGRVPEPGDLVLVGDGTERVAVRVEAMDGRRVERVGVRAVGGGSGS